MKPRDYIDAEFTVVGEPKKPHGWNGVGLPPEWPAWPLRSKIVYVVVWAAFMALVYFAAHWLGPFVSSQIVG